MSTQPPSWCRPHGCCFILKLVMKRAQRSQLSSGLWPLQALCSLSPCPCPTGVCRAPGSGSGPGARAAAGIPLRSPAEPQPPAFISAPGGQCPGCCPLRNFRQTCTLVSGEGGELCGLTGCVWGLPPCRADLEVLWAWRGSGAAWQGRRGAVHVSFGLTECFNGHLVWRILEEMNLGRRQERRILCEPHLENTQTE